MCTHPPAACLGDLGSAHFIAAHHESCLSAATPPLVPPAGVAVPKHSCYTTVVGKSPQLFKNTREATTPNLGCLRSMIAS